MFERILVANRGEIAVRVMRACRELGITTVAIFSDADRDALHVRFADEAYRVGPAPALESYLDSDKILEVCEQAAVDAVHPGYGFLSENGDFAEACEKRGVTFIGPSGQVMRTMGDKVTARQTMAAAGVPIVPGTTQELTDEEAIAFSLEIGLPVMVKASAGGGGKGMRLVHDEKDLAPSIERARSEARASFGNDALYIEKFVEEPRHIEIQILADRHGNTVHLFERECSIQRRHQKVIEEAPGNGISEALRSRMGAAAVAAARAVDYVGGGTCEFLVDKHDDFYFLEMNTRVQVEHAITEAVTGVDIVKAMIRVAAGEPLGLQQDDLSIRGHAIEARIYAEDPDKKFLPSPGKIAVYRAPEGIGIRVDSGVSTGSNVTVYYDPMVAKLVAFGADRPEAIERLARALSEFAVVGIKTSIPFHERVLAHPVFRQGRYDTGFIDDHMAGGAGDARASFEQARRMAWIGAAISASEGDEGRAGPAGAHLVIVDKTDRKNKIEVGIELREVGDGTFDLVIEDRKVRVDAVQSGPKGLSILEDGRQVEVIAHEPKARRFEILVGGHLFRLEVGSP